MSSLSFQDIINRLQQFWQEYGCAILQPYDMEVGAGTFHPATVLKCLGRKPWNVSYVQPSRRPTDSRFGNHPNRSQRFYQFQVILKPSPDNIQQLYLQSLKKLHIYPSKHDIRFVEDDWESPTLGASGLGWEVWCNGMEISQFTYLQKSGGIACKPISGEITYGLERLALYIQGVDSLKDISWNGQKGEKALSYGDISSELDQQFSHFNIKFANTDMLLKHFIDAEEQCTTLISHKLPLPAYDYCIKANHIFNLLDARGVISVTERANYISRMRNLAKACSTNWLDLQQE